MNPTTIEILADLSFLRAIGVVTEKTAATSLYLQEARALDAVIAELERFGAPVCPAEACM